MRHKSCCAFDNCALTLEVTMGILRNIHFNGDMRGIIVHRFDVKNDQVNRGSVLTVREGQAAIFCHQGKMADVFLPGVYKLDTNSIPILTRLMSWKFGFQNPVRVDIFFVNTTQFLNEKWGTTNPINVRCADFGNVAVRGFGTYSFKVDDPFVFMTEISGQTSTFATREITEQLRAKLLQGITVAIGASKVPFLDLAANLKTLADETRAEVQKCFEALGLKLTNFIFQNFSLPEHLQKELDAIAKAAMQNRALGKRRENFDLHVTDRQLDVMQTAAGNQAAGGMMGGMMGAGMGMGMGMNMGNMMGGMMGGMAQNPHMNPQAAQGAPATAPVVAATPGIDCPKCKTSNAATARFCKECGSPTAEMCKGCNKPLKPNSRFCHECGQPTTASCSKCSKPLKAGARFCGECGTPA